MPELIPKQEIPDHRVWLNLPWPNLQICYQCYISKQQQRLPSLNGIRRDLFSTASRCAATYAGLLLDGSFDCTKDAADTNNANNTNNNYDSHL